MLNVSIQYCISVSFKTTDDRACDVKYNKHKDIRDACNL